MRKYIFWLVDTLLFLAAVSVAAGLGLGSDDMWASSLIEDVAGTIAVHGFTPNVSVPLVLIRIFILARHSGKLEGRIPIPYYVGVSMIIGAMYIPLATRHLNASQLRVVAVSIPVMVVVALVSPITTKLQDWRKTT